MSNRVSLPRYYFIEGFSSFMHLWRARLVHTHSPRAVSSAQFVTLVGIHLYVLSSFLMLKRAFITKLSWFGDQTALFWRPVLETLQEWKYHSHLNIISIAPNHRRTLTFTNFISSMTITLLFFVDSLSLFLFFLHVSLHRKQGQTGQDRGGDDHARILSRAWMHLTPIDHKEARAQPFLISGLHPAGLVGRL